MSIEKGFSPEVIQPKRRARIFFVRHGEPVIYGEDTSLTENGRSQVEDFAEIFAQELSRDTNEKIVKILKSDRIRTTETANIIDQRVHRGIKSSELKKVISKSNIHNRHSICPDNTLDMLTSHGVPLESAYQYWLSLSHEQAGTLGTKWSGEVAYEAYHIAHNLGSYIGDNPVGPDFYYVMATHETTLGAILLHSPFEDNGKIGYAQHLEVEASGDNMCVKSNGFMVGINKKEIDWNIKKRGNILSSNF